MCVLGKNVNEETGKRKKRGKETVKRGKNQRKKGKYSRFIC